MNLKIAQVTATFPPYSGGTGNVAYHNALQMVRRGHDVHVFTSAVSGAPEQENMHGVQVHRLEPVFQVGNAPLLSQLTALLADFDIIHLHYPFISGAELVRYAAWRNRLPFIVTFHNDLIGEGMRKHLFRGYQRASAGLTVKHANRLCVVSTDHFESTALARTLGEQGPEVVELPNGVDTDLFSPGDGSTIRERFGIPGKAELGFFVAALDRAHHFKGLGRLLETWARLDSGARLLIAGDGDLRASYEQQSTGLGIAGRVVFVGEVKNHELAPFYRAADVTILPSSPPESFGLVLIESLACGTPVIASNLPGVRTVVANGVDGYLVEQDSQLDLQRTINHMLSLFHEQRRSMGAAGRRRVKNHYSWERIGDILENLYFKVLGVEPRAVIDAQAAGANAIQ